MTTVGTYLAKRLEDIGISSYFAVPGDYNLSLLDELLINKKLQMINCCNELNAGYAADGYARVNGISAMVVTFCVGGLSAINAITGAFGENLPVIIISGAPNTNSVQDAEILHHTIATENNDYVRRMFAHVTAHTVFIHRPKDAPAQIDEAIAIAKSTKKPVYIEIACNIASLPVSSVTKRSFCNNLTSDPSSLKQALKKVAEILNSAVKPVLIAGSKTRTLGVGKEIESLSKQSGYALAAMADAKGFVNEDHPNFMGIYWGPVSSANCEAVVESSDLYFFIGPNFNDYTTVGHVCNINYNKAIILDEGKIFVRDQVYTGVSMLDFLQGIKGLLKVNRASIETYHRIKANVIQQDSPSNLDKPVSTRFLFEQIQKFITKEHAILAETGDSWFNGLNLKLPKGCQFEIQMQYGSIGWSVGALLGMQAAFKDKKRVVALIGDGSFQMSAQELSTLVRYDLKPIIFLMNNASYGIEVQIHDGPYNVINNWQYHQLLEVFNGKKYKAKAFKVSTYRELLKVMAEIPKHDGLCFVEVILDKNDCNKNLLDWGARVAAYNSRSPRS